MTSTPFAATAPRPITVVYAFLDLADGGAQRLTLGHCLRLDRTRFRPEILCVRGPLTAAELALRSFDDAASSSRSPTSIRSPNAPSTTLINDARSANIPVHLLGRLRRPYDLAAVPIIAARLRSISPRIVHVPLYSRAAPYIRLAARLAGGPLVVAHEWSRAQPLSITRQIADRLLQPDTRFIAVSEHHARSLIADGVRPADIQIVIDGVDTTRFHPQSRDAARAELDLPADRSIALVPARLHPAKGHADLIAAMPTILSRVPNLLVLCAGDGPLRDRLPLDVKAADLSESSIRFLGQRNDMPELFAVADIVVLPSHVEGMPSAMLEAFASARPVVATDVGGVREALVDGEAGRLVPPGDPAALAQAIIDLLIGPVERSDPADPFDRADSGDSTDRTNITRAAMGARGRALALEHFRAEDSTRRLEAAYEAWL